MGLDLNFLLNIDTVAIIFCSVIFGYLLCKYMNHNTDEIEQKVIQDLIERYNAAQPIDNISQLRRKFLTDYSLYLPLNNDGKLFERVVKTRNKWNEWLLYLNTFNNNFKCNFDEFCVERKNIMTKTAKHIEYTLKTFIDQYDITKTEIKSDENSQETILMNDIRKRIWNEIVNHSKFNWKRGAIAVSINHENFKKILSNIRFEKERSNKHHYLNLEYKNEYLLSVDLVTANFQSLKYLSPLLVNNCSDYQQFINQFTKYQCFKNSKIIRQRVFGKIIPKIIMYIERCFMRIILNEIGKLNVFKLKDNKNDLIYLSHDEIVFKLHKTDEIIRNKQMKMVRNCIDEIIESKYKLKCRLEIFELKVLSKNKKWFVKKYMNDINEINDAVKLMSVPGKYYLRAYNHIFGRKEHSIYDRIGKENNVTILSLNTMNLDYKYT